MAARSTSFRPLLDDFSAAADGKADGRMVVEGRKLQPEALAAGMQPLVALWTGNSDVDRAVVQQLAARGAAVHEVPPRVIERAATTRTPQSIQAIWQRPTWRDDDLLGGGHEPTLLVVAAGVKDPGNLGALLRVGEAAGATGVLAIAGGADPFRPKAVRAAAGSTFRLPVRGPLEAAEALAFLRRHRIPCLAADGAGTTALATADLGRAVAIMVGGEGPGLATDLLAAAEQAVRIPMRGAVESLNVAVAAGVLLYEARRQRDSVAGR